eukprot:scaffold373454_cov47-Prasinocladus_malaysianus.AAC.1
MSLGSAMAASKKSSRRYKDYARSNYALDGEILKLFPSGLIERPATRYTEEEWDKVVHKNNSQWPECLEAN